MEVERIWVAQHEHENPADTVLDMLSRDAELDAVHVGPLSEKTRETGFNSWLNTAKERATSVWTGGGAPPCPRASCRLSRPAAV